MKMRSTKTVIFQSELVESYFRKREVKPKWRILHLKKENGKKDHLEKTRSSI